MAPDRLPSSPNTYYSDREEDDEFEEEEEDGDEQVAADTVNRKVTNNDTESESDSDEKEELEEDNEAEDEADEEEEEEEEDEEEKTVSPVRGGLDYGSDADSGNTVPSPSPSDFVLKESSQGKKRAAESKLMKEKSEVKKSKKEKKKGEKDSVVAAAVEDIQVTEDKTKRGAGQRIWGPEDELMIVKGMMDYKEEKGVDFNSNLDAFYQFIKGQLNAVVDKSQLVNKIRKLKEKFRDNAAKEANGEEPVFLKSHEVEVYEYSKRVWGGKAAARSKSKSNKEKEAVVDAPAMEVDNLGALPFKKQVIGGSVKSASQVMKPVKNSKVAAQMENMEADVDVEVKDSVIHMPVMVEGVMFEKGLELVEKSKVDALNKKWTKYQMDAAELFVRRVDLIKEQTELILDAMKSNL